MSSSSGICWLVLTKYCYGYLLSLIATVWLVLVQQAGARYWPGVARPASTRDPVDSFHQQEENTRIANQPAVTQSDYFSFIILIVPFYCEQHRNYQTFLKLILKIFHPRCVKIIIIIPLLFYPQYYPTTYIRYTKYFAPLPPLLPSHSEYCWSLAAGVDCM